MLDANILITAFLKTGSTPEKSLLKALKPPNQLVISEQIVYELNKFYVKKLPLKHEAVRKFIHDGKFVYVTLMPSDTPYLEEQLIRDPNDRPILRAALKARVDIFVTGDKDFLESTVTHPRIMTASEFLNT
jgi:predicted nucleic acid-binding protein